MTTVYKRAQDAGTKRQHWYFGYTDENGERQTRKGFTDKGQTEQLAAKIQHEAMLRRRGLIDPEDERAAEKRNTPLSEHVDAFEQSLRRKDTTAKHVKLTMTRVRRIVDDASMETIGDIEPESVEEVLAEMLESNEIGHKTYNHYLQAIDSFCNWMVPKRMNGNPLVGMERLNTEMDIRHPRRALSADEFNALVVSARESDVSIQCFDGEERARIYLISYFTGLRRKEIGSLTPFSFDLVSEPATVTVEAACSKHRRKDVLPLHPEFVAMLSDWLPDYEPDAVLFPKLGKRRTWLMVKKDLERVGIAYQTSEGIADFHAAGRHTHITGLLRGGVSLTEAKELARHSDVRMTMRYTHHGLNDQAEAIRKLAAPFVNAAGMPTDVNSSQHATPTALPATSANDVSNDVLNGCEIGHTGSIPAASTL